jgi:hypothetical protein
VKALVPVVLAGLVWASAGLPDSPAASRARELRVRVTLNSGAKLEGFVRGGALYERLVDGQFVRTSSVEVPGAGFRLWQVNDTSGFFFVRYSDIRELKEIRLAGESEVAASGDALLDKRLAGEPTRPTPEEDAEKGRPERRVPELSEEGAALLERFPPEAGWTPEKKAQLERRAVILGLFPSPEEKAWLESFDAWRPAYEHWLARQPEAPPPPDAGSGGTPDPAKAKRPQKAAPRRRQEQSRPLEHAGDPDDVSNTGSGPGSGSAGPN